MHSAVISSNTVFAGNSISKFSLEVYQVPISLVWPGLDLGLHCLQWPICPNT